MSVSHKKGSNYTKQSNFNLILPLKYVENNYNKNINNNTIFVTLNSVYE